MYIIYFEQVFGISCCSMQLKPRDEWILNTGFAVDGLSIVNVL
jgi:hypothetical protein